MKCIKPICQIVRICECMSVFQKVVKMASKLASNNLQKLYSKLLIKQNNGAFEIINLLV